MWKSKNKLLGVGVTFESGVSIVCTIGGLINHTVANSLHRAFFPLALFCFCFETVGPEG